MFSHAFPQQRSVVLTQTYRSTQRICRAVTALIDVNVDRTKKTMWTANEKGEPVHVIVSQHASGEIDTIVAAIQKLRRPHPPASATSSSSSPSSSSSSASSLSSANAIGPPAVRWSQICVLARTRRVLTSFESVFKKAGFPMFSTVNHSSAAAKRLNVHKARELVDVLAYCDLICSVDGGSAGSSGILDRAAVDDAAGEQQRADAAFRRVYNTPKRSLNEEVLREIESQARMRYVSVC